MGELDLKKLTRMEACTVAAIQQLRGPDRRQVSAATVVRMMKSMGWDPPKHAFMLTMRRMKSIELKLGADCPFEADYRLGRGQHASYQLKSTKEI